MVITIVGRAKTGRMMNCNQNEGRDMNEQPEKELSLEQKIFDFLSENLTVECDKESDYGDSYTVVKLRLRDPETGKMVLISSSQI